MTRRLHKLLVTQAVAAELLSVSPRTLETWRMRETGPPWVRLGDGGRQLVRYPFDRLKEWIEDRTN